MKTKLLLEVQSMVENLSPAEAAEASKLADSFFPSSKGRLKQFFQLLCSMRISGAL